MGTNCVIPFMRRSKRGKTNFLAHTKSTSPGALGMARIGASITTWALELSLTLVSASIWESASVSLGFQTWMWLPGNESACQAGDTGDVGSIPGSGRYPGEGNGCQLQYSCLGNPMDRGAWRAAVHGVIKSQTQLSNTSVSPNLSPQCRNQDPWLTLDTHISKPPHIKQDLSSLEVK